MADAQPLYSTDVDQWLLENFPTAKGANDAYDAFSAYLYGSVVDDHEDGDNDASDEEDRKAVKLALTWHATSTPPPLLERYLGLGLRSSESESSATSETQPAAAIIPGSASSTADVPPPTKTLLERMSCGIRNASKPEWRSSSRTNQREEFLRRTARGNTPSVLQELPTNRPLDRNPKDVKAPGNSRGGSRGPPPYRRGHDSVRDHGPGRDLRYDQPRRGGVPERSDSTARRMPPRRPNAAARKDTPQLPRRPTNTTAPSAPPSLQPAQASPVPAAQDEQRVSRSQSEEAQLDLVQAPATVPEPYLRLATDPTSRGLMARIYKLVAIAYMYRAGSVRMQHVINALCVAYQATDPPSQPEVASRFNPPSEWHEAMVEAFLSKMLVDFAEEDTTDVANELLETIPEIEKAIEDGVQPPPLRKYLVVALILYIEHLIQFGVETIEEMKDWPKDP